MISRVVIAGIFAAALLASIYAAFNHYTSLVEERASLRLQVETSNRILNRMALERSRFEKTLENLRAKEIEARRRNEKLVEAFEGGRFGRLLKAKPELLVDIINRGTLDAHRLLERASGADNAAANETEAP